MQNHSLKAKISASPRVRSASLLGHFEAFQFVITALIALVILAAFSSQNAATEIVAADIAERWVLPATGLAVKSVLGYTEANDPGLPYQIVIDRQGHQQIENRYKSSIDTCIPISSSSARCEARFFYIGRDGEGYEQGTKKCVTCAATQAIRNLR